MALGGEVVDLVRLEVEHQVRDPLAVGDVAVVQEEPRVWLVLVLVQVFEPHGVERARTADDAMHLVPFFQQQLGQVGAILAGDAGDERAYAHCD